MSAVCERCSLEWVFRGAVCSWWLLWKLSTRPDCAINASELQLAEATTVPVISAEEKRTALWFMPVCWFKTSDAFFCKICKNYFFLKNCVKKVLTCTGVRRTVIIKDTRWRCWTHFGMTTCLFAYWRKSLSDMFAAVLRSDVTSALFSSFIVA